MDIALTVIATLLIVWLGVITYLLQWQGREIQVLLVALKHIAGAEKHLGGTGRNRRRTDFRVPVQLSGFLRVQEHARPCHIIDLSRSGAQVKPEGGAFPVGEVGVLTIEFGEFDSGTTHVKVVRAIESTGTYGLQFVDMPQPFQDKCVTTIRRSFRGQLGQT
jgi:hypothetical protein